jgi:hypothetical protein
MTTSSTIARTSTSTQKANRDWSRRLALGAVAGPILFTVAWLILGALSPGYTVSGTWISPYSAISQPISGLGLGETARHMNTAFVSVVYSCWPGLSASPEPCLPVADRSPASSVRSC